jgi:hypothetical protein
MAKSGPLDPQPALAAEAALELMKQLITLSSGVLALSATFIEKLDPVGASYVAALVVGWLALVVAVVAALETISAIVKSRLSPEFEWSEGRGRKAAAISKYSFVVGIVLVAAVALGSWSRSKARESPRTSSPPCSECHW